MSVITIIGDQLDYARSTAAQSYASNSSRSIEVGQLRVTHV